MDAFFKWLSGNPIATTTLIVSFGVLVTSTTLIYLVAFFQGRIISFWPPNIGDKPQVMDLSEEPSSPSSRKLLKEIFNLSGKVVLSPSVVIERDREDIRRPDSQVAGQITPFLERDSVSFETEEFPIESPMTHLIVIGSTRLNKNAELIQRYFDIPYEYLFTSSGEDPRSRILKIVTEHGDELTSSRDFRAGFTGTEADYGILFLGNLSNEKKVFWIGGIHGSGTEGVFQYLKENAGQIRATLSDKENVGTAWLLRIQYEIGGKNGERKVTEVERLGRPRECTRRDIAREPRALICDLGDVVMFFDRTRTYRAIAHFLGVSFEEIKRRIESTTDLRQRYERGTLADEEFLTELSVVVGDVEQKLPRDLLGELWGDIFWPNNEMIEALRYLKQQGVILVLLSNTNPLHFHHVRRNYPDLVGLFDEVVLSYKEKKAKPDQDMFLSAIRKVREQDPGISVEDILYVDDKTKYIRTAHELGIKKGFVFCSYTHFVFWLRKMGLYIP